MTGQELFHKYTDLNDQSSEQEREYSQTLFTIFMLDPEQTFHLLEEAEKENKKLSFKESELVAAGEDTEPSLSDVIFV